MKNQDRKELRERIGKKIHEDFSGNLMYPTLIADWILDNILYLRNMFDRNSGYCNSGYKNSGNWNSGNMNSGDCNTGDSNIGHWNSGDSNSGDNNTGQWNSGCRNSGNWNSGHWNSGYCNSETLKEILVFNKSCKLSDWNKATKPHWMFVNLTKWINESEMNNKEKETYPYYVTTGGYLKVYGSLKEAYVASWEKASKEDRELTFKLPNFDEKVFKKVFGFTPKV